MLGLTFIPNPDNLPEVNHKDNISSNYPLKNLEWTNRRGNLSHAEKLNSNNQSSFVGVARNKKGDRWTARVEINKKKKHIGTFDTEQEASDAYVNYLKEHNIKNDYI